MPPTFASAPGGFNFASASPATPTSPASPSRTSSKSSIQHAPSSPTATAPSSVPTQPNPQAQMQVLPQRQPMLPVSMHSLPQRRPMSIGYIAPPNGGASSAVGASRLLETDPLTDLEMETRTALEPEKKDRTKMFVIGGIALVVIVVIGVIVWRRMKK